MVSKQTDNLLTIFIIVLGIIIVYQIIRTMLGGSWQFESIVIALLVLNLSWSIKINSKIDTHLGEHRGFEKSKQ